MTQVLAQHTDVQQIETTINYYLDGVTNGDLNSISKAFDKNATMKFVADEYKEFHALTFFKEHIKPNQKQNQRTSIVSISVLGNAANAYARMERSDFTYHDFLHLLKINGEWKIVSKIFYKKLHQ